MDFVFFSESGHCSEYYNNYRTTKSTNYTTNEFVVFVVFQYKLSEYVVDFVVKNCVPVTRHREATVICSKILDFHGFCSFRWIWICLWLLQSRTTKYYKISKMCARTFFNPDLKNTTNCFNEYVTQNPRSLFCSTSHCFWNLRRAPVYYKLQIHYKLELLQIKTGI